VFFACIPFEEIGLVLGEFRQQLPYNASHWGEARLVRLRWALDTSTCLLFVRENSANLLP
jgi:hypothetical protein